MKTLIFTLFLSSFYLITSCATQPEVKEKFESQDSYTVLSQEKFDEIQAKVHLQEDWIPIRLEGYSKAELVSFYIQSYLETTVETWVDFAYNKMHRFEETKPTDEQEVQFLKFIDMPRTRENMHKFMMLMTYDQIETVGY